MTSKIDKLTGPQKAAMLLLGMGESFASEVFKHLEDKEIQLLGQQIAKLDVVSTRQVADIIEEFTKMMESPESLRIRGDLFFKNTIAKSLEGPRQQQLLENLDFEDSPDLFQKIKKLDGKTVANFLRNEHPQTVSVVLAHLDRSQAGAVLSEFPENLQVEIIRRIAYLDPVPPGIIEEIDTVLKEEISLVEEVGGRAIGGAQSVAEILNQMERAAEGNILKRLEEAEQEDLADEIRRYMFTFEDLLAVDNRAIMAILKEINTQELALALKATTDELKDKFFKNMSERAADMLREELEIMGPVRLRDVETAQQNIIQTAKRLEAKGVIVLASKGSEDVFV
ncbi:MAG: flagellar motor switch protein FliG [Deltaproteobacteria bacterium]|nr:MAG: flagellar motor switch protein FliG [Deltaproteobacteria bacterium]